MPFIGKKKKKDIEELRYMIENPMKTDNHDSGKPVVTLYWLEVMGVY